MATERQTAELIIKAITEGFEQVSGKFEDIEKSSDKAEKGVSGINASLMNAKNAFDIAKNSIGQVVQVVNALADAANEAVAFDRATLALETYSGSAEEATKSVELMQEAMDGSVSKIEATSNASTLFSMKLVDNAEEAAHMAEVALTLGKSMGNAEGAFSDFTLMLANQSIQRLDTFGISSGQVRVRIDELMESVAGLDRQTAFTMATMEIADKKLIDLKESGFEAASSFEKLGAYIADAMMEGKQWLKEFLTPAADATLILLQWHDKLAEAYQNLSDQVMNNTDTYEEYIVKMLEAKEEATRLTAAEKSMLKEIRDNGKAVSDLTFEMWDYNDVMERLSKNQGILTQGEYNAIVAGKMFEGQMVQATAQAGGYSSAIIKIGDDLGDLGDAENELTEEMQKELDERNKLITQANQTRIDEVAKWSNIETQYVEDMADLNAELAAVQAELSAKRAAGYNEQGTAIQGLIEKEGEIQSAIDATQDAYDKKTKAVILGYMEQKMAADGILTDEETEWLLEQGVQWGIYADGAVEAYRKASEAADEAMGHFQDKTVSLTVNVSVNGANSGLGANELPAGVTDYGAGPAPATPVVPGHEMMASGGSFSIPAGFVNDSFPLGGGVMAQSGEVVNVSNQDTMRGMMEAMKGLQREFAKLPDRMAQSITRIGG